MTRNPIPPHLNAQERALRAAQLQAIRPKLAATLVLWHGNKSNPRILMGQRHSSHDFMPNVYVFPGGRIDRADSYIHHDGALSPRSQAILSAALSPRRARAVMLAAIRETFEETGLLIGQRDNDIATNVRHSGWQAFRAAGTKPDINGIEVFGRAITPPHRHKRFDTWFLIKHLNTPTPPTITDSAELLNVGWFHFDNIPHLKTQRITTMMLRILQDYLQKPVPPPTIHYSAMIGKTYTIRQFP